jgi:hypothetical protein
MTLAWIQVALGLLGAVYAVSLPFSGWLVLEAGRIRGAGTPNSIISQ